nr:protein O-linked-mannose beta-1,2-N-acetylglucosaminyltransferase 1-like [Procambarus clarkii]
MASNTLASWLLVVAWACGRSGAGVAAPPTPLRLTVALPGGGNHTLQVQVDPHALADIGVTKEELEATLLQADEQHMLKEVVIGERTIPVYWNISSVISDFLAVKTVDGGRVLVSIKNYTNVSLHDFDEDPSLRPASVDLTWTLPPALHSRVLEVTLTSGPHHASVSINDTLVMTRSSTLTRPQHRPWARLDQYGGCYLQVLNPHTGRVTLTHYFNTVTPLLDLELARTLQHLREGRVALITSYHDCSMVLEPEARKVLHSLGSWAAQHLSFGDGWAWVWRVGGPTLAEALLANMDDIYQSLRPLHAAQRPLHDAQRPLHLHLNIPQHPEDRLCSSWPSGGEWEKRHYFCDLYDGYGDLCSCDDLLPARPYPAPRQGWWRENMVIVVLAWNRPRYLYRLLHQLLRQPGVRPAQVLVSVDGVEDEPIRLVEVLGLRYLVHTPEGDLASPRISRHLRFALFKALETFEDVDKFIILEEDLILAPDFFSFMQQTSVLLEVEEDSLYGVSAFSHLSSSHTSSDLTRLQRVTSFPSCGWMTTRTFLTETLPKWLPVYATADWDFWMGTPLVRGARELVLPEVSRTSHGGMLGAHMDGDVTTWYHNTPLSTRAHVALNLTAVRKTPYEESILEELKKAQPLDVSDPLNLEVPHAQEGVWVARVRMLDSEDSLAFRMLAQALNLWHADARDHHFGLWRLPYYSALVFVVGVPYSRYSSLVQGGGQVLVSTPDLRERFLKKLETNSPMVFHQPDDFRQILGLTEKKKR